MVSCCSNTVCGSCSQTVCAVLGVALGLQAAYMPYEHGFMNWLEFLSLISSTITIYFSLYFTYSVTPSALVAVTVVVTVVNVLTIAVFVIALIRANWHLALESVGLNPQVRLAHITYTWSLRTLLLHKV